MRDQPFSPQRAIESILFIAECLADCEITGAPTLHEVLKLRYFADKLHMGRYGFVASGDDYSAMEFGPVASQTYDLLKAARGDVSARINPTYADLAAGGFEVRDHKYIYPIRRPVLDALAPTDIECLRQAVDEFGRLSFNERTEFSHDQAWQRAWNSALRRDAKSERMPLAEIATTLENSDEVLEYMSA